MAGATEELTNMLAATRKRLLAAIEGVTEEQFHRRPEGDGAADAWSISEVLAHLLASERLRTERIALALAQNGAPITPSPPGAHEANARAGRRVPVPQIIHGLLAVRRELERTLTGTADLEASLGQAVIHPQRGRDTVRWMLNEKVIGHEAEHAAQIEALRPAVGAPALSETAAAEAEAQR